MTKVKYQLRDVDKDYAEVMFGNLLTRVNPEKLKEVWQHILDIRSRVRVGSSVKLGFATEVKSHIDSEWMWVRITKDLGEGNYVGKLDNHPTLCPSLHLGDEIEFEARHIYGVEGV